MSLCAFGQFFSTAWVNFTGDPLFSNLNTLAFLLLYFGAIKAHLGKKLFVFLMVSNLTNSTVYFAEYLETLLFPNLALRQLHWSYSLTIVLVQLVSLPLVFLFFKKQFRKAVEVQAQNKIWRYLWLIPATFYLFWFYFIYINSLADIPLELDFISISFIVLVNSGAMLVYYIIARTVREFARNLDLRTQNNLLAIQNLQYENLKERMDETRRARHDLRHHMAVLHSFCQNGEYDQLTTYLQNFLDQTSADLPVAYCSNLTLNALLNYYAQIAEEHKINFSIDISLPQEIPMQDTDLCVLLGNLIENAYDECLTLPEDKRHILLKMLMPNHSSVVFTLDNTFSGHSIQKNKGQFLSSKHEGYGIGIDSAANIVERYNGVLKIDTEGKMFCISVVLNL